MSIKKQERGKLITRIRITIAVIIILAFIAIYPVLFQEGNPLPILKGITALNIKKSEIVQISDEPRIYLTKTEEGVYPVTELMEREGWKFDEQLGAGYIFSKDNSELIVESTQYTGKYTIWKLGIED